MHAIDRAELKALLFRYFFAQLQLTFYAIVVQRFPISLAHTYAEQITRKSIRQ